MPKMVSSTDPRIAKPNSFFCGRSRSKYRLTMPPLACLAALELRGGVQQQQNAGEVLIELVRVIFFSSVAGSPMTT